ncbi:MAG: glycosyltransferase [Elusimicrobia bacterium]|nr:glycosyltransferase [Elusimicrobiota bacterium]
MPSRSARRVLLVNLEEAPENLHLEMALVRESLRRRRLSLDVVHGFNHEYDFIPRVANTRGWRLGGAEFDNEGLARPARYAAAVFIDIPSRRGRFAQWSRLVARRPAPRLLLACNHLMVWPAPGTAELADAKTRALSRGFLRVFDQAFLLSHDYLEDREGRFRPGAIVAHDYALDCRYYAPLRLRDEGFAFSAGTTQRDYPLLRRALAACRLDGKIFADAAACSGTPRRARGWEVYDFNENLDRVKAALARARLVVVPIRADAGNPGAGLTIALMGMAMGKPVVARDTVEMRRYIRDGHDGFLYEGGSAASLERAISRAAAPLGRAVGRRARRAALRRADMGDFAALVLDEAARA